MYKLKLFTKDTSGDAVVEAAILFPIMIMIFAALVLLAIYLPTKGTLQRATLYAATAIATESSDAWLHYNVSTMSYNWETNKDDLENVYVSLFSGTGGVQSRAESIVADVESRALSSRAGTLRVGCHVENKIVYKEVVVTATREYPILVNLTFIRFPDQVSITVTSTAVVQNGDEFIRNVDLAADFAEFATEQLGLSGITGAFGTITDRVSAFFGWR